MPKSQMWMVRAGENGFLFDEFRELENVPRAFLREVEHFFSTYKQLEGVQVKPLGWVSRADAIAEVTAAVARFRTSK